MTFERLSEELFEGFSPSFASAFKCHGAKGICCCRRRLQTRCGAHSFASFSWANKKRESSVGRDRQICRIDLIKRSRSRGSAPARRPTFFVCPKKVGKEKHPTSLPFGFPAFRSGFAAKKKTRAFSPQTVFFEIPAKLTLHSGGVTRESQSKAQGSRLGNYGSICIGNC
jgi:hypothetical protein